MNTKQTEALKLALEALEQSHPEAYRHTITAIREALAEQPAQQQEPEYKGWYCTHCQRGVDGSEVTYHEQHTVCGRVITDDLPPSWDSFFGNAEQPAQQQVFPACRGMNCGCTDGTSHSPECQAEHAAAIAGGVFVKTARQQEPLTDAQIDLMTSHIYHRGRPVDRDYRICLFRQAEAAHGITGEQS